jgi:hypothetical protein
MCLAAKLPLPSHLLNPHFPPFGRRDSAEAVVAAMGGGATLEAVTQLVEELSRLH